MFQLVQEKYSLTKTGKQGAPWFCSPDFSVPWAQNRAHRNRACFVAATICFVATTDSAVSPAHNTTNATSWKINANFTFFVKKGRLL